MRILNPIYDTVFKYLMEDIEIAKGLISTIIEQEVVELIPAPQEQTSTKIKIKYVHIEIQHLDYVAHIKTIKPDGSEDYKKVMIEVQKSPFTPDIGRFRKYLAEKYKNISILKTKEGEEEKRYLPLKTIYLIEKTFNNDLPSVLKSNNQYIDILSHKEYKGKRDKFVDLLTHEAYFIQLQELPRDLQNAITRLLSVFTPWYREKGDERYVDYPVEENDLEKITNRVLRRIIRRLHGAVENDKLKLAMEIEIEYEDFIEQQIAEAGKYKKQYEKQYEKQIEELEKKDKVIEKKDKVIEKKDLMLQQEQKAREKGQQRLINSAIQMKQHGLPIDVIVKATGLSRNKIEEFNKNK